MDAALDLLAERGEDGVTLWELTDAAEANVAAVSYHFGSLKSLCDATSSTLSATRSSRLSQSRSNATASSACAQTAPNIPALAPMTATGLLRIAFVANGRDTRTDL